MSESVAAAPPRERVPVRVIAYVALVVVTAVAAVMTWQAFAYHRLFAWLAEWQFRTFDQMFPVATILLPAVLIALPLVLLIAVRMRRRRRRFGRPGRAALLARDTRVAQGLKYSAIALIVAAVGLGLYGLTSLPIGDKPAVSVSIANPAAPTPGRVAIQGVLLTDRTGLYRERFVVTGRDLYVAPLVPATRDTAIRYFVQVPGKAEGKPEVRKVEGILRTDALPGALRRLYENAGYKVASPVYVIFDDAASSRWPLLTAASDLALLGLLLGICWLIMRRHLRQLGKGQAPSPAAESPAA